MPCADLISIVITTYNRSGALACVLHALESQSDLHFEVVVADDGSADDHQAKIQSLQAKSALNITHVWHPDVGFTASQVRNLGVAASKGNYIILLDGDCVPESDFVARHRLLAEKGCFVNGSRVLLNKQFTEKVEGGLIQLFSRSFLVWIYRWMAGQSSKALANFRLPDISIRKQAAFKWKGIRSCNMSVYKSDYIAVNGFDETFVGWGHEDADFVLRLHNAGLCRKNGFWSTEVYHLWHRESSRDMENVNAQLVRERIATKQIRATVGYEESLTRTNVRVSSKR
ncbi:glycosyltransferase family 2 protein [Rhodoferax sp.]|uniref:glycosyltransferase family 2 protein n=1 Tax=Rhodoferax sp. TaxID=50421 RepID=UPI0025F24922|nr:glycosyltransferase family 2 protein [Rhodoferax sp.]